MINLLQVSKVRSTNEKIMCNLTIMDVTFRMEYVSLWWTVGLQSSITLGTCPQPSTWTLTW